MALRLLIPDAVWSTLEPLLRESKHAAGAPPRLSDRLVIEAVLYQARTGTPWRDLPDEFGHWNAVYQRFRRWEKRHLWARLRSLIEFKFPTSPRVKFIVPVTVELVAL